LFVHENQEAYKKEEEEWPQKGAKGLARRSRATKEDRPRSLR
jgi:hypothetical protein